MECDKCYQIRTSFSQWNTNTPKQENICSLCCFNGKGASTYVQCTCHRGWYIDRTYGHQCWHCSSCKCDRCPNNNGYDSNEDMVTSVL